MLYLFLFTIFAVGAIVFLGALHSVILDKLAQKQKDDFIKSLTRGGGK